jgi:glycerol-3-phosphate O-acyltransferase
MEVSKNEGLVSTEAMLYYLSAEARKNLVEYLKENDQGFKVHQVRLMNILLEDMYNSLKEGDESE